MPAMDGRCAWMCQAIVVAACHECFFNLMLGSLIRAGLHLRTTFNGLLATIILQISPSIHVRAMAAHRQYPSDKGIFPRLELTDSVLGFKVSRCLALNRK